jgi:hypothetical protein
MGKWGNGEMGEWENGKMRERESEKRICFKNSLTL